VKETLALALVGLALAGCTPDWAGRYRFVDGSWTAPGPATLPEVQIEPANQEAYRVSVISASRALNFEPARPDDPADTLEVATRVPADLPFELPEQEADRVVRMRPVSGDLRLLFSRAEEPQGEPDVLTLYVTDDGGRRSPLYLRRLDSTEPTTATPPARP
jgi:hypothetical protein